MGSIELIPTGGLAIPREDMDDAVTDPPVETL
jgi:hypothetical protein